jgi:short-subunit dehydrogenase
MRKKGWAVVTGASAGLGAEFVRQLAKRGHDIVLVARRRERLEALAREVEKSDAVKTEIVEADLAAPGATAALVKKLDDLGVVVEVLVNNAGVGLYGFAIDQSIEKSTAMIELNVVALTELSLAFARKMAERGSGGILNVSSTASFQPDPYFAVYGATKAYVTSFSVALACEVKSRGVRVLAHCPGPTRTEFNDVADVRADASALLYMSPERCVAIGLRALERGKWVVVTGWINAIAAFFSRRSPLRLAAPVAGYLMRPVLPSKKA